MIFVSYFTKNTPYESVIKDCLLPGLEKFKLNYDIQGVEDRGSWYLNTAIKSKFILDMLNKHKQAVCFIDSDAKIIRYPELLVNFPDGYDIGYFHLDWNLWWRSKSIGKKPELLSGTMVFNYTPNTLTMASKWYDLAYNDGMTWEQKILQSVVESMPWLNIYKLPVQYCTILKKGETESAKVKEPIILHTQVSRKYRDWGN